MSYLWPRDGQFATFQSEFSDSEKIVMLNLLKFKPQADYGDSCEEPPCTGEQAFERYRKAVSPLIHDIGGRVRFLAQAKNNVIGPDDENWDLVILVEYPNATLMGEMIKSSAYQAIAHHRTAATEDSRLIPTLAPVA